MHHALVDARGGGVQRGDEEADVCVRRALGRARVAVVALFGDVRAPCGWLVVAHAGGNVGEDDRAEAGAAGRHPEGYPWVCRSLQG